MHRISDFWLNYANGVQLDELAWKIKTASELEPGAWADLPALERQQLERIIYGGRISAEPISERAQRRSARRAA